MDEWMNQSINFNHSLVTILFSVINIDYILFIYLFNDAPPTF